MTHQRPNIVLICTDQQRMDALACYGNRFVESPRVDGLALAGTRFTHAFTPWPVCTPARATMWTGVYPHQHGVIDSSPWHVGAQTAGSAPHVCMTASPEAGS